MHSGGGDRFHDISRESAFTRSLFDAGEFAAGPRKEGRALREPRADKKFPIGALQLLLGPLNEIFNYFVVGAIEAPRGISIRRINARTPREDFNFK